MITISILEKKYMLVVDGAASYFSKIHPAMVFAEQMAERGGKRIEWAQDPASGEYVGFPYTPQGVTL